MALAERLRIAPEALVFAGEVTKTKPATDIASVRSFAEDRDSVRLWPEAGEALRQALAMLRAAGDARASLTALASRYIQEGVLRDLQAWRQEQLFDLDEAADITEPGPPVLLGPPKVSLRRRVIKIDAQLHEAIVATVLFARTRGRPQMLVVDAMDEAAADFVFKVQDELNGGEPLPPVSAYGDADLRALRGVDRPVSDVALSWGPLVRKRDATTDTS